MSRASRILRRRIIIVTILIAMVLTVVFAIVGASEPPYKDIVIERVGMTIIPGDTLWSIASMYMELDIMQYHYKDIRSLIYEIKQLNGLSSTDSLQVGQLLYVPMAVEMGEQ